MKSNSTYCYSSYAIVYSSQIPGSYTRANSNRNFGPKSNNCTIKFLYFLWGGRPHVRLHKQIRRIFKIGPHINKLDDGKSTMLKAIAGNLHRMYPSTYHPWFHKIHSVVSPVLRSSRLGRLITSATIAFSQ